MSDIESRILTGNEAAAYACRDARVQVVSAYPITPQSPVTEKIAEFIETGQMTAQYVCVESEHSAITVCIAASTMGARVFTATSANGLCLMHEQLHWAAGARLPLVMACVNRGVAAPWTIWTDEQDSFSQRDTGWIQIYVENNQEIYDAVLQAYRIAEACSIPVMVCYDGYILSHTAMPVTLAPPEEVQAFLPPRQPVFRLDPSEPCSINLVTMPEPRLDYPGIAHKGGYMDLRYRLQVELREAKEAVVAASQAFQAQFGRDSGGLLRTYRTDGAETILVAVGTLASESRDAVDALRSQGIPAGLVSLRLFRPFPAEELVAAVAGAKDIMVWDRNVSYGNEGCVCTELKAALFESGHRPRVFGLVAGLGGRDVGRDQIVGCVQECLGSDGTGFSGWTGSLGRASHSSGTMRSGDAYSEYVDTGSPLRAPKGRERVRVR